MRINCMYICWLFDQNSTQKTFANDEVKDTDNISNFYFKKKQRRRKVLFTNSQVMYL